VENLKLKPFNIQNIKGAVRNVTQFVQDDKIEISRKTITKFQYAGSWPDKYNSFVTSETRRNKYENPSRFFITMKKHPEWYAKKFIFRPIRDTSKVIRDAVLYANRIMHEQSRLYGVVSGFYGSSFDIAVDGKTVNSMAQLNELDGESVVRFVNTAPYASTVEKNALYYTKIGGVIFHAAQLVLRKYPELGVRFVFAPAEYISGANHPYQVPTLTIGSRENVTDKLSKPGKNQRSRRRAVTFKQRKARLEAKAASRTAAGRRGDYG
jgi:hypothetical protein